MNRMEATSCLKAVVLAANQYRNNKNDANLVHLQRQLDVLISITAKGASLSFFDPQQLLPTECLTCLVNIINDPQVKPDLALNSMILLNNLAHSAEVRTSLHETFHLTSSLARYLCSITASLSDPVTKKCVEILQRITYGTKIAAQENYVDDLIKFLIKNIQGKETELTQPCLGVLANLCRYSYSIQSHVKNIENVKSFYKALITFLSNKSLTTVVFSLSILTTLCLHEELGERLFNAKNIHQTFQLMFNILVNGDTGITQHYAVDLFTDLLKNTKIQQSLVIYEHLPTCIKQIMSTLSSQDHEPVSKMFELLLALCSVQGLRTIVCRILSESSSLQSQQNNTRSSLFDPFFHTVRWSEQPVDGHSTTMLNSVDFLREFYEEVIDSGMITQLTPRLDLVLPGVTKTLTASLDRESAVIKNQCLKIVKSLQLLTTLCSDDTLKSQVVESVNENMCCHLLETQYNCNPLSIRFSGRTTNDPVHWSETGVDIVLYTLDLMLKLKTSLPNMEGSLHKKLVDQRTVPFLAHGMSSEQRERVQMALSLFSLGTNLEDFPSILLGDSIAAKNSLKTEVSRDYDNISTAAPVSPALSSYQDKENLPFSSVNAGRLHNNKPVRNIDGAIDNIIEKMQTGLELKDLRQSEIINVYEHKIQSLETKENHLQDLLEAKALALVQADRLISQYRCRRAQSQAEAARMRSLIQDSERRIEEHREQLNETMLENERLSRDVEHMSNENHRLQGISDEFRDLTQMFTEQTQRLENTNRTLIGLRQEHKTLNEMHEMLQRHNETLKQQHDVASQQLTELEEERKTLSRQLKDKEVKVTEYGRQITKIEEKLKKVERDRDELEEALDKLRSELSKTELTKKELHHQVTTLEVVCQKHESAIKEKDKQLNHLNAELEKHKQITTLIHSLSGGKPPE